MTWHLTQARGRFGEVMDKALAGRPQTILRDGDAVVVISRRDYERLTCSRASAKEFLLEDEPNLHGVDLGRHPSPVRHVNL